jgi:hypothetical protein
MLITMDETLADWDWQPSPCEHTSGWVTAYIEPYSTTLECPECGEQKTVHDE